MSHPSASLDSQTGHPVPHPHVAHQFADLDQQRGAGTLGMWLFLASEIMFFGGLFTGYAVMRNNMPHAFALAASNLSVWLGGANTAVLLTSSFTMVLAVWAAQTQRRSLLHAFLGLTIVLGSTFLVIKAFEWREEFVHHLFPGHDLFPGHHFEARYPEDYHDAELAGQVITGDVARGVQMFFVFYFIITGLHALHMVIGLGALSVQLVLALRSNFGIDDYQPIEISGLYWHFVDVVWIFVFPIIYLLRH